MLVGLVAVTLIALSLGGLAWVRTREARLFSQAHTVSTYSGTNYVLRLTETTLGRAETNYLLMVQIRVQNPNPFPLKLSRKHFILVDHDKDYYLPNTTGTQTEWFTVPPRGVAERETLSFAVPADSFAGSIGLQIGQIYWVLIKHPAPYEPDLRVGEFVTFRRRHW